MGRRSTPERIYQAKRAAIVARLEGQGWTRETAEEWCTRWEAQHDDRHAHDYWQQGAAWITEQRRSRRP
jgi:hypothetical protein